MPIRDAMQTKNCYHSPEGGTKKNERTALMGGAQCSEGTIPGWVTTWQMSFDQMRIHLSRMTSYHSRWLQTCAERRRGYPARAIGWFRYPVVAQLACGPLCRAQLNLHD